MSDARLSREHEEAGRGPGDSADLFLFRLSPLFTGGTLGQRFRNREAMDQIDYWRGAKLVLDEYGDNANDHAARRIAELTSQGDVAGAAVWAIVLEGIAGLRGGTRPPDGTLH
jgi:hypothetical protein